jgi:hypothetical protein
MFISRRKLEAMRQQIVADVLAALDARHGGSTKPSLAEAGDFYASAIGAMGKFLEQSGDLAVRGAASALGQRGGRAKAAKRAAKAVAAAIKPADECAICRDPLTRNLSVESINRHRFHEQNPRPADAIPGPQTNGLEH